MVEVNIHGTAPPGGQPPSGPPGGKGRGPGPARPMPSSDYSKALAQQAAQIAAEAAKARQMNTAFNQHDADARSQQAALARLTNEQIKIRNQTLDADKKALKAKMDRQRKDEQDAIRLANKQRMEDLERGRQEWALRRTYGNMAHRAGWHLSPTGFRGLQRQSVVYGERVDAFRNRWGRDPFTGDIRNITSGMGSLEGTYHVQNVLRMGSAGQRFAFEGNFTELVRIERELRRIENLTNKQLHFSQSPTMQANLERQKNALLGARAQIEAGLAGHGRIYNTVGRGVGFLGAAIRSPIVSSALAIGMATAMEPFTSRQLAAKVLNMGRPYRDWRIAAGRLGLAGGYNGSALADRLMPLGGIKTAVPGMDLTAELSRFGLSPQQVVRYGQLYGVPMSSAADQVKLAETTRMASLAPGMNLSEEQLLPLASQAKTLSGMAPDAYFRQLLKVQQTATTLGINSSQMASGFSAVLSLAGKTSLSPVNVSGFSDLYARMSMSPVPSFRTGEGESTYLGALNKTLGNLGNQLPASIVTSQYFARVGRPTSEEDLRRKLGVSMKDWTAMTAGAGKAAVNGALAAAKQGDMYGFQTYIGTLIQGQPNAPDIMNRMINGSGLVPNDQNFGPRIRANVIGTTLPNQLGYSLGAAAGSLPSGGMVPGIPSSDIYSLIVQKAAQYGVPLNEALALVAKESGFNPNARNKTSTATGLGQVLAGTAQTFGYTQADMLDPTKNLDVSMHLYSMARKKAGGDISRARDYYHYGLNSTQRDPQDDLSFMSYSAQYGTQADVLKQMTTNAQADAMKLAASGYANEEISAITATLTGAFDYLTKSAEHAAEALSKIRPLPGGYLSGNTWVPNITLPPAARSTVK